MICRRLAKVCVSFYNIKLLTKSFSSLDSFPGSTNCHNLKCGRPGFDPWVGKMPWRKETLPTPVFWPGESHGLYSPRGCKESDTTERLSLHSFSVVFWGTETVNIFSFDCGVIWASPPLSTQKHSSQPQSWMNPSTGFSNKLDLVYWFAYITTQGTWSPPQRTVCLLYHSRSIITPGFRF